jgi:hypothetical protein
MRTLFQVYCTAWLCSRTFLKLSSVGVKAKAGGYSRIFSWVLKLLKAIQKKGKIKTASTRNRAQ